MDKKPNKYEWTRRTMWLQLGFSATYAFLWWLTGHAYIAAPLAFVSILSIYKLQQLYIKHLDSRIEKENGPTWSIEMNNVSVGDLSDSAYASIRKSVFMDTGIYIQQGWNLMRAALNAVDYCYKTIPLSIFWVAIAWMLIDKDSAIQIMQQASPENIVHAVGWASQVFAVFCMFSILINIFLGYRFGFINKFDVAINERIRQYFQIHATGDIDVRSPIPSMCGPNELDWLKRK